MLPVDVLELAVVIAGAEPRGEGVGRAGEIELVAGVGLVAAHDVHVVAAGRLASARLPQLPRGEGETLDLAGGQQRAVEGLRQQAHVVAERHRQLRHEDADL